MVFLNVILDVWFIQLACVRDVSLQVSTEMNSYKQENLSKICFFSYTSNSEKLYLLSSGYFMSFMTYLES